MQWNCLHCSRSDKVGAYITAVHVLLLAAWSAQLHAAVSARCVRLFPVWTVVESVSSTARKVAAYPSLVLAEQQHDLIAVDFSRNSCFIFFSQHLMFTADISSGLFSRTTWVSWYQKGKTSLDLNEARDTRDDGVWGWQWHQLDHMQTVCTSLQTDNHTNTSSFNFYRPEAQPSSVKALKVKSTEP